LLRFERIHRVFRKYNDEDHGHQSGDRLKQDAYRKETFHGNVRSDRCFKPAAIIRSDVIIPVPLARAARRPPPSMGKIRFGYLINFREVHGKASAAGYAESLRETVY
jgi:hypothetical protein